MAAFPARVVELRLPAGALLALDRPLAIQPGQYLLAGSLDVPDLLPVALHPSGLGEGGLLPVAGPLPPTWTVGARLAVRGPLGSGFNLPVGARRVLLAALTPEAAAERLLPLAGLALARGAEVAICCAARLSNLPAAVELLPPDEFSAALAWADFLALDAPRWQIDLLRTLPALRSASRQAHAGSQALVVTEMPCGGLADCAACAVSTRTGPRLACKDGPVFPLFSLLDER